jgi:APA family basic amino acid/polyamine antiporter
MKRKLNVGTLSGLLVGPVLGSGVILLPPMALGLAGTESFAAWGITLVLMGVFAGVTAALCMRYPGDGGLVEAVGAAFGPTFRDVCGCLMLGAVCFGPAAVSFTAGTYLADVLPVPGGAFGGGISMAMLCLLLLQRRVTFVGMLSLVSSTLIGLVLFAGSVSVLLYPSAAVPLPAPSVASFGRALVLLFWAITGWEILGNYTLEIERSRTTVPAAVTLSFTAIAAIYLAIAKALPLVAPSGGGIPSMADLLRPLFGAAAPALIAALGAMLCGCTYMMVVGGVSRLAASMAERGKLPRFFAVRNENGIPVRAVVTLGGIHLASLSLAGLGVLNLASLVGTANGLFLLNALLIVCAAVRLLSNPAVRIAACVLAIGFAAIFSFADRLSLLAVVTVLVLSQLGERSRDSSLARAAED